MAAETVSLVWLLGTYLAPRLLFIVVYLKVKVLAETSSLCSFEWMKKYLLETSLYNFPLCF